jgi:hypothetical protein
MISLDEMVEEAARNLGVEIPEYMPEEENSSQMSKSQRVRDYLEQFPEARNKDIAEALSKYGVRPADVANTKAQMKKREAKSGKKKTASSKEKVAAVAAAVSQVKAPTTLPEIDASVQLHLLEAGVEFVRKAGGINEAQHILGVIRRIRSL